MLVMLMEVFSELARAATEPALPVTVLVPPAPAEGVGPTDVTNGME